MPLDQNTKQMLSNRKVPKKPKSRFQRYIIFVIIAVGFMILIDRVLYPDWFAKDKIKAAIAAQQSIEQANPRQSRLAPIDIEKKAPHQFVEKSRKVETSTLVVPQTSATIFSSGLPRRDRFSPLQDWFIEYRTLKNQDLKHINPEHKIVRNTDFKPQHLKAQNLKFHVAYAPSGQDTTSLNFGSGLKTHGKFMDRTISPRLLLNHKKPSTNHKEASLQGLALQNAPPKQKTLQPKQPEAKTLSPSWVRFAAPVPPSAHPNNTAKIVIIIDDLGQRRKMTHDFINLPGPLTLSFLPYASDLQNLIDLSRQQNHEAMLHVPMEPMSKTLNPGPDALKVDMSRTEIEHYLIENLSKATGYVGINNHMGSRLTQDESAMDSIMQTLHKRGLLFIDSRTINRSVALKYARLNGVPSETRDIFLDHEANDNFITSQLKNLEKLAHKNGQAIAIGHPYPQTLKALEDWLPTLKAKGIDLVPVSALIRKSSRAL